MSLFKPFKGLSEALKTLAFHDGYAYLTTDDGKFTIDAKDSEENEKRITINPDATDSVKGMTKVYTGTGANTDGTMTQKAITAAIKAEAGQEPQLGTEETVIDGDTITYTDVNGRTVVTTFNNDGSITQVDELDPTITYTVDIQFVDGKIIQTTTAD